MKWPFSRKACQPHAGTFSDWAHNLDIVPTRSDSDPSLGDAEPTVQLPWLVDPARPFVSFVKISVVLTLCTPLAYMLLVSPLFCPIPEEIYLGYYWVVCSISHILFSEALCMCIFNDLMPLWALLAGGAACFSVGMAELAMSLTVQDHADENPPSMALNNIGHYGVLLLPAAWRIVSALRRRESPRPAGRCAAIIIAGSLPVGLSVVLAVLIGDRELVVGSLAWAMALLIWTIAPWLVKYLMLMIENGLLRRNPASLETLTRFYVHLVFNVMGVSIFLKSPVATFGFSVATLCSLGFNIFRGLRWTIRCTGGKEGVARLIALTDAYCDMVGRVVAFVMLLCSKFLHVLGADVTMLGNDVRYSLVLGKDIRASNRINFVQRIEEGWVPWAAVFGGLATSAVAFLAFVLLLPRLWRSKKAVSVKVVPYSTAEPETQPEQQPGGGDELKSEAPADLGDENWLGKKDCETPVQRQWLLLASLASDNAAWMIICVVCVMIWSSASIDLSSALLEPTT